VGEPSQRRDIESALESPNKGGAEAHRMQREIAGLRESRLIRQTKAVAQRALKRSDHQTA
jgi:hypothetical protein